MPKRALILELRTVHGFVIPSQAAFLKAAGYEVHIVVTERLIDRDLIEAMQGYAVVTVIKKTAMRAALFQLYRAIASGAYDFICMNSVTRDLMLFMLLQPRSKRARPFRAIIHRANVDYLPFLKPLRESGASPVTYLLRRAFLNRVERLYLLSESAYTFISTEAAKLPDGRRWSDKLSWFAPSYYPTLDLPPPPNQPERVIFAVMGEIDLHRRNYGSLMAAFQAIRDSDLFGQIEIRILGSVQSEGGAAFLEKARAFDLIDSVIKTQTARFIPFLPFAEGLAASHFALLLLDHQVPVPYNTLVVPSALMLAPGFGVPMVSSTDLPLDAGLRPFTLTYDGQAVIDGIRKAVEVVRSGGYAALRQGFAAYMQAAFSEHQARYLD
ncbi:MAG: hypothetical protein SF162_12785 [bacterium]|nr:hypothetical protein [bacterium]